MNQGESKQFRTRSLIATVHVPNLFFSIGQGAIVPITALLALELGASPAMAGVIVAARGLGTMLFDLPAGAIVWRLGEKKSMVFACIALAGISAAIATTQSLWLYAVLTVAMGCTWAVWVVGRVAFATGASPPRFRGRVMSTIGGVNRIGRLIGPLAGALLIRGSGLQASFLLLAVLALAAALSIGRAPIRMHSEEPRGTADSRLSTLAVVKANRRVLATAGTVAVTSQILRSSREALVPLWGDHLGIATEVIPLIFAVSAALESVLFYPVGLLMDRKGRKFTAVPSMALLTLGILTIPLTYDAITLTAAGVLMGVANGIGTGMNMTLGSDLAPLHGRSRFLSIWRLITDSGAASGPLLVALATTLSGLPAAAVVVAGVGGLGSMVLWKKVPETLESDTQSAPGSP